MTALRRQDIAPLLGWTQETVKNWLLIGLDTWRHGSELYKPRSAYAFPGAERVILGDGDIITMLAEIDGALDERSRAAFATGCAAALASLRLDDVPRHAGLAEDLISLGTKLGGRDLLPVLADVARIAGPHTPGRMRLLHFALRYFASAASSSPRLLDAKLLRRVIANYTEIPPRHAVAALSALVKVEPKRLIAHLDLLAKPLDAEFGLRPDEPNAAAEERAQRRAHLILSMAHEESTHAAIRRSYQIGSLRHADGTDGQYDSHWWTLTLRIGTADGLPSLRKKLGLAKQEELRRPSKPASPSSLTPSSTQPVSDEERRTRRTLASPLFDKHLRSYDNAELQFGGLP